MSDYDELKCLAEALIAHEADSFYLPCTIAFERAATPSVVLAMIAENESLRKVANELRRFAVCEHMHHDKIDQHEYDEPCKVLRRIDSELNRSPENP